ncbi:MAG: hypothetical protein DMG57_15870 [Acidobacteria bacterium]|nr:MAG: hypothetical protein DMG57_15870 [Acidobacteriota bacterium]
MAALYCTGRFATSEVVAGTGDARIVIKDLRWRFGCCSEMGIGFCFAKFEFSPCGMATRAT